MGLHDLYRALDLLAQGKEESERGWLARVRDPLGELSPMYFEVPSTYLVGSHPEGLASFGYSRDERPDRKQLCLEVVVAGEGLPVAHLLLPGMTADHEASREAIAYLGEELRLRGVVIFCDRGMVSGGNLSALKGAGLSYIVAIRMRRERVAGGGASAPGATGR